MPTGADPCSGKVVVLLGATGALGMTVAQALRSRGARLGVAVRRSWQVERMTQLLGGEGVLVGCVAPADGEAAAGFHKGVQDALGPVDALLCTNGAFRSAASGADATGDLQELLTANLLAGATMARAVVGPMKRRRAGSLVFVGSAQVGHGGSGLTNYLASKAALHEYVRALSVELAGSGVRAAALLPTVLDTEANRQAMPAADRSQWQHLPTVAARLLQLAFEPPATGGPLFAV